MTEQPLTPAERRMNDHRITKLEGWTDGHDKLCAERYKNLEVAIVNSKTSIDRIYKMIWGCMITIIVSLGGIVLSTVAQMIQRGHIATEVIKNMQQ